MLVAAGDAWAEFAGGTSGVLWGAGIRAAGLALGDTGWPEAADVVRAWRSWVGALSELGKAKIGDKTILDAAVPFVDALESNIDAGVVEAWRKAAEVADDAAQQTAQLAPRIGRARPLAARSIGNPDPGAVSFAICVHAALSALGQDQAETSGE